MSNILLQINSIVRVDNYMNKEIENKIRICCKKYQMDCDNLEIIAIDDTYMARDKKVRVLFDKDGNVSSLPMNYTYGKETTKFLGKSSVLLVFASFITAILFVVICGLLKKL